MRSKNTEPATEREHTPVGIGRSDDEEAIVAQQVVRRTSREQRPSSASPSTRPESSRASKPETAKDDRSISDDEPPMKTFEQRRQENMARNAKILKDIEQGIYPIPDLGT